MYRYAYLFLAMATLNGIVLQATKDNIGKRGGRGGNEEVLFFHNKTRNNGLTGGPAEGIVM